MVNPTDVPRILLDAARLLKEGEIVVFGSAALAFVLPEAPRTRDIDVWCDPPERGELLTVLMGELSWYQSTHGVYVEVWAPETFAAPLNWRSRAKVLTEETAPDVRLVVPHPHDILFAKLERWESGDREHARRILAHLPMDLRRMRHLLAETPYRVGLITDPLRIRDFEGHVPALERMIL